MADEVRLIDASKIEIFLHQMRYAAATHGMDYDVEIISIILEAVEDAPTIEAEPVNDWISVKDRLPEPKTWVLAYIKYPSPVFEIERGISKTSSIKKVFYDGKSFYCGSGTVTHWQHLPEPPKEDAE